MIKTARILYGTLKSILTRTECFNTKMSWEVSVCPLANEMFYTGPPVRILDNLGVFPTFILRHGNLLPRVLRLLGQRAVAGRDSRQWKCYRRNPAVNWRLLVTPNKKKINYFNYPRVSLGDHPLTKKPEVSGYEIGKLKASTFWHHTCTKTSSCQLKWVEISIPFDFPPEFPGFLLECVAFRKSNN